MSGIGKQVKAYSLLALGLFVTWAPPDGSLAQEQELSEIRIQDLDRGYGVFSDVTLIRSDKSEIPLGHTNENGVLPLPQPEPCNAGMIIEVEPHTGWYKNARKNVECTDPEVVELQLHNFAMVSPETNNLLENIDNLAATDDPALAALLYNDLAVQVAPADQDLSYDYAERAVHAWASATDFSGEPLGPDGGSKLTPDFFAYVVQHQESMGLEPTGSLDYLTFATEANHDIFWFRHGVYPEPGAVPTRSEPTQCVRLTSSEAITRGELPLVTALVRAAEESESTGEYGNAALLFNEARARVGDDTMMAFYTELRIYENASRALNVPDPTRCDPIQRRFVMTPVMVEAVRAHQQEQPTGILDYQTLRSLAHVDVGPVLARLAR